MQVGRFIKRLINPEPEEKGEAKRDERESESGAGEESSTNFVQVEGFSDSQLGEPVSASVEPESSPDLSSNSSDEEETIPEPEQQPEPGPEPDAKPEEELQTASSLYATDSELREAGLDPDDLGEEEPEDPEQPEAPEANEESEPVSEAEPELVEAEAEQPAEEEQPEEASSATPDEPEPEPEPAISAPNIDEELSLARSAVESGFVVTLATELRTPISSLRVSFDLLKDPEAIRNNPVESNRLVENIERSIVRLERQASDLLEVGYIHNGNLTLAKEPLLVSEPVLAAIDISRPAATLRKVAIELEMEPDLPRVITDGLRLTQIVSHLLSNAIKFTPVGGSVVIDLPPIALPLIISDSRPVEAWA